MDGSPVIPYVCFFFNDTATTEIYTLSLHDALPILSALRAVRRRALRGLVAAGGDGGRHDAGAVRDARDVQLVPQPRDRKSTRLNSSHANISYAVFCLKKKK